MDKLKIGQRWQWIWNDLDAKTNLIVEISFLKIDFIFGEILQVIETNQNQYIKGSTINSTPANWKNNNTNTFILLPNQNSPENTI